MKLLIILWILIAAPTQNCGITNKEKFNITNMNMIAQTGWVVFAN